MGERAPPASPLDLRLAPRLDEAVVIEPGRRPAAPLDLELPAVPQSVARARHAVAAFCAGHELDHDGIALAVSEAVTNAVTHAYRDGTPGQVYVSAQLEHAGLLVVVADDGQGMAPRTDSPGMGLGIPLIARLASALEIAGDGAGTSLTMRFERAA